MAGSGSGEEKDRRFHFVKRRSRLDWATIHSVDPEQIARDGDIGSLESALGAITFGDLSAEDPRRASNPNLLKALRLSQLATEYLLHVQVRAASSLPETLARRVETLNQHVQEQQKQVKRAKGKYKQEKEAKQQSEQDLRKIKRSIRAYEALEQARAGAPLETVLAPAFTGEVDDGHAQGERPSSPEVERAETLARIAANKAQEEREQQSKESAESARRNGYDTAWNEAKKELAKKEDEWRQSMWSLQSEKGMLEGRVAELVEERNALSRQLEEARNEAWKHKEESSSAHSLVYQVRNQVDRLEEENSELRKEPSRTGNPLTADASTSTDFDGSAETMDELRRRAREAERRAKDAEDELQRAKAAMEGRLVQHQVERFESTADQTRRDPFDSGDAELLQPSFGAPRHSHANTREEETGKIDEEDDEACAEATFDGNTPHTVYPVPYGQWRAEIHGD